LEIVIVFRVEVVRKQERDILLHLIHLHKLVKMVMGIEKQPLKFYMNRLLFVENSRESKIEDINLKPDNLKGLPEKMSRTHRKIIKDIEAITKIGPEGEVPRLIPTQLHETLPSLSVDTTLEVQERLDLIKKTEELVVVDEKPETPEPPKPEPPKLDTPAPVKKKKAPSAKPFRKKLPKNNKRMGR